MFKTSKSSLFLTALLSLAPAALASVPRQYEPVQTFDSLFAAPSNAQQQEVSQLLKDISAAAFQTSVHAGRLESFTRIPNSHSWQAHSSELTHIKDLVNSKGKTLERLKKLRDQALPWQQRAIDRIQPLLASLADETTKAIQHINESRRWLFSPDYKEMVSNMYIQADEVRDYIAVKLDYAEARARLAEVEAEQ
jgi:hypothetical protein